MFIYYNGYTLPVRVNRWVHRAETACAMSRDTRKEPTSSKETKTDEILDSLLVS